MEKVLIITYYWPPSGGAGVQRILKFVKYLPEFEIKPYIVTVKEDRASYPVTDNTLEKDIPDEAEVHRTDTFEPYGIYSGLLGKKSIPTGFSNESNPGVIQKFSRFIRGNLFIPDARKGWIKFAFSEACKIIEKEKIKTVITTSPPHSVQLTGLKLKKKYNDLFWIADLRDPWTDIYYYNEFNHLPFARNRDAKFEKEVLIKADRIITVSNDLKRLFSSKSSEIAASKIFTIPNGFDEEDFKIKSRNPGNDFIITYTGTMADSYYPQMFFHSLKSISGLHPDINFRLRFIGNPSASLIEYAKGISLSEIIEVIPTVSHDESVSYLLSSTALLLVIPEIKNDKGIITGKLFEYLAARKPIICIGPPDGDAAEIISECKAGKTFGRNMNPEIENYLNELIAEWKNNKNLIIENENFKKYSRYNQAKELAGIIKKSF